MPPLDKDCVITKSSRQDQERSYSGTRSGWYRLGWLADLVIETVSPFWARARYEYV